MFIIRNFKRIYLTPTERQRIYQEKRMEYAREDAKKALMEYYGIEEDSPEESEAMKLFHEDFGLSFKEASDITDSSSLVSTMAWEFVNKFHDCNIADNDTWRDIITMRIAERKRVG